MTDTTSYSGDEFTDEDEEEEEELDPRVQVCYIPVKRSTKQNFVFNIVLCEISGRA